MSRRPGPVCDHDRRLQRPKVTAIRGRTVTRQDAVDAFLSCVRCVNPPHPPRAALMQVHRTTLPGQRLETTPSRLRLLAHPHHTRRILPRPLLLGQRLRPQHRRHPHRQPMAHRNSNGVTSPVNGHPSHHGHSSSPGHPDNASASTSLVVTNFQGHPDDTDSAPRQTDIHGRPPTTRRVIHYPWSSLNLIRQGG